MKNMKWQEVMTFLSGLGMGAMLVQKNGIIAAINEVGKSFLAMSEGVGTPVPDNARPLLLPLKDKQIAHIAFEKWVRRVKCPLVQGIPEGMELIVFRDAACDVYREMFQNVLNRISESVILCDEKEQILFLNDAAVRMDSLLNETVVGKSMDEVYKSESDMPLLLPKVLKAENLTLTSASNTRPSMGKKLISYRITIPSLKTARS